MANPVAGWWRCAPTRAVDCWAAPWGRPQTPKPPKIVLVSACSSASILQPPHQRAPWHRISLWSNDGPQPPAATIQPGFRPLRQPNSATQSEPLVPLIPGLRPSAVRAVRSPAARSQRHESFKQVPAPHQRQSTQLAARSLRASTPQRPSEATAQAIQLAQLRRPGATFPRVQSAKALAALLRARSGVQSLRSSSSIRSLWFIQIQQDIRTRRSG